MFAAGATAKILLSAKSRLREVPLEHRDHVQLLVLHQGVGAESTAWEQYAQPEGACIFSLVQHPLHCLPKLALLSVVHHLSYHFFV